MRPQTINQLLVNRFDFRVISEKKCDSTIAAPIAGKVVKILVAAGDQVKEGQGVVVLEAMKMENEIKAPAAGEVIDLRIQAGDSVSNGEVLAVVRG